MNNLKEKTEVDYNCKDISKNSAFLRHIIACLKDEKDEVSKKALISQLEYIIKSIGNKVKGKQESRSLPPMLTFNYHIEVDL